MMTAVLFYVLALSWLYPALVLFSNAYKCINNYMNGTKGLERLE